MTPATEADVLVGDKLTGKTNYQTWKTGMQLALESKDCWQTIMEERPLHPDLVTNQDQAIRDWLAETEEVPENGFSTSKVTGNRAKWRTAQLKLYTSWAKLHSMAKSAIYHSCKSTVQQMIASCETASDQWKVLEKSYSSTGFGNVILQLNTWKQLSLSECKGIEDYTNRMRATFAELKHVGAPVPDLIQAGLYLAGLGSHFNLLVRDHHDVDMSKINLQTAIDRTFDEIRLRPLPKKDTIKQESKPTKSGNSGGDSKPSTTSSSKPASVKKEDKRPKCGHCGKTGHSQDNCFKLLSEKMSSKSKDSASSTPAQPTSASGNQVTTKDDRYQALEQLVNGGGYIYSAVASDDETVPPIKASPTARQKLFQLDSGATHHMTNTKANYISFTYDTLSCTVANGQVMESPGYGDILIDIWMPEGHQRTLRLNKVWYFPDVSVNLISYAQLEAQEMHVLTKKIGNMQPGLYKNDQFVSLICKVGNGYFLRTTGAPSIMLKKGISDAHCNSATAVKQSARLWHRRYGHLGISNLKTLPSKVEGVKFVNDFGPRECDDCILANMKRSPRDGKAVGAATEIHGLVHTDLCGPITPEACKTKARYMMPIVDDYTRQVRVYFMHEKSEAAGLFQGFMEECQKEGHPVKGVRFDNGGEYSSRELTSFLKQKGLLLQPTPAYSPESNGLAERTNGTLFYKCRVMLRDSGLPRFLWQQMIATAAYLHNRSPNRALGGMTPYEKRYGKKPEVNHLRIPGCRAFIFVPKEKRRNKKLDDRGKECHFVGYTASSRMYVVYVDGTIRVERDIIFDEGPAIAGGESIDDIPENDQGDDPEDVITADGEAVDYSTLFREETVPVNPADQALDLPARPKRGRPRKTAPRMSVFSHVEIPRVSPRTLESYDTLPSEGTPSPQVEEETSLPLAQAFLTAASTGVVNVSLTDAKASADWPQWRKAIQTEWNALVAMGTWEEVPQSSVDSKHKVLSGHWVLTKKPDRFKARFVVHGNQQRKGIDYTETYAGTARSGSVKILLALAAIEGWADGQLDACNAFLNAHLSDLVYVFHPPLYKKKGFVLRLRRALYGLCTSPREWWQELVTKLKKLGFRQCQGDLSVFVNAQGVILIVYVDDIALFAKTQSAINVAKQQLMSAYKMRDIGQLKTFIGIQIERQSTNAIFIHQKDYTLRILERFGFDSAHPTREPMNSKLVLSLRSDKCPQAEITRFQEMVGSLMWLSTITRPDIQYAVSKLAQFNVNPSEDAIIACKHVFRFLRGTPAKGILYSGSDEVAETTGYSDACWGDLDARDPRSTTGYVFKLAGGPISWASRRQRTVATSSTESEYIAQCSAVKEAAYLRQFLGELGFAQQTPTVISADNRGAIALSKGTVSNTRSRHINFQYHFTQEKVNDGTVSFVYIPTAQMAADGLTKPLAAMEFRRFQDLVGVVEPPAV
jgi:transposase InsO family protein